MADRAKIVVWDSCAWIGLINSEADKITPLRAIWEAAERGEYEIIASVYSYIEVVKGVTPYGRAYPPEENDEIFEQLVSQSWVKRAQVDVKIARTARALKRKFHSDGLGKRSDAFFLSTAVELDADELHTFDGSDLLVLRGKVQTKSGKQLIIRKPGPEDIDGALFARAESNDEGR